MLFLSVANDLEKRQMMFKMQARENFAAHHRILPRQHIADDSLSKQYVIPEEILTLSDPIFLTKQKILLGHKNELKSCHNLLKSFKRQTKRNYKMKRHDNIIEETENESKSKGAFKLNVSCTRFPN